MKQRSTRILVHEKAPSALEDLTGYSGFLTTTKLLANAASIPTISSVSEIDHLRTDDIVVMEPKNGFIGQIPTITSYLRHNAATAIA
jgi:hypothetical protein